MLILEFSPSPLRRAPEARRDRSIRVAQGGGPTVLRRSLVRRGTDEGGWRRSRGRGLPNLPSMEAGGHKSARGAWRRSRSRASGSSRRRSPLAPRRTAKIPRHRRPVAIARQPRLELGACGLEGAPAPFSKVEHSSASLCGARNSKGLRERCSTGFEAAQAKPTTNPLHPSSAHPRSVRVLPGGRDWLLTVREVAERLGVCTATVYSLCERGELAHLRVSNAIRIEPAALDAYLARVRR